MKIAIDIDNTILTCRSLIFKLMSVVEKKFSFKITKTPAVFRKGEARIFANQHRNLLFGKMGDIKMYDEIDGAIDVINKLYESGHSIVFLSNRPNIRFLNSVVMNWLEENKVNYDIVVINCGDKVKFCKEHGVDLLIDDSLRNCKAASKAGIKTVLFGANDAEHEHYVGSKDKELNYEVEDFNQVKTQTTPFGTGHSTYLQGESKKDEKMLKPLKTWKDVEKYLEKYNYTLEDGKSK